MQVSDVGVGVPREGPRGGPRHVVDVEARMVASSEQRLRRELDQALRDMTEGLAGRDAARESELREIRAKLARHDAALESELAQSASWRNLRVCGGALNAPSGPLANSREAWRRRNDGLLR